MQSTTALQPKPPTRARRWEPPAAVRHTTAHPTAVRRRMETTDAPVVADAPVIEAREAQHSELDDFQQWLAQEESELRARDARVPRSQLVESTGWVR